MKELESSVEKGMPDFIKMVQSPQSGHQQRGLDQGGRRDLVRGTSQARQQMERNLQKFHRKVTITSLRTDNSIKNHFYSTVRKCLRTISKMRGEKNTTITMKSIKPYVLSKIVENSELTDLIVQLGRSKFKGSNDLNIEEQVL